MKKIINLILGKSRFRRTVFVRSRNNSKDHFPISIPKQMESEVDSADSNAHLYGTSTQMILKGLGITTQYLSNQSAVQNEQLISLLLRSQEEISLLRNKLDKAEANQAKLLSEVSSLNSQIAESNSKAQRSENERLALKEKKKARKRRPLK